MKSTETGAVAATRGSAALEIAALNAAILEPGIVLGERYEIVEMLGVGGMGAVYKAHDRQIDRIVALKVIRPDLANNPELLARFKQELLLAREISHKNVVRIYDLHESGGVRFITMEFIAGRDLRGLLAERGKLPGTEAIEIIRQVCSALAAAHAEGILHRDLKPGNIMREANGRVVLMDFGLARTLGDGDGLTQTGGVLGTMEYMSPEQSMAAPLDERSDLFAVGLILYELLTGTTPYQADSAIASLVKRSQEPAPPISKYDPTLPASLVDVVARCLERDRDKRYRTVNELIDALDTVLGRRPSSISSVALVAHPRRKAIWSAAAVLILAAIGVSMKFWLAPKAAPVRHKPVTVLIGDFQNYTGDPIFNDTLEPMLNIAVEGASFINTYNRGTARKLAGQLPHPTSTLDEQTARLIAISQTVGDVVTGTLSRRGDGYELSVQALDATTGNLIGTSSVTAANKDDLLLAVPKLAVSIRKALGDRTPASVQLDAARGPFTAASLEVVHLYGLGMEQQVSGNMAGALASFSQAVQLDPNFTRAYAGMAAVEGNLGHLQAAEKDVKLALEHVDRMTERERYRVRGLYYARTGDWQNCIQEYSELARQYPADDVGHNNLAYCYKQLHNTNKAIAELKQTLEILPNNQIVRTNLALYAAYSGDPSTAQAQAERVLHANSSYEKAYVALAYAQVEQGNFPQAIATYQQLGTISALGHSLAVPGLADVAIFQGRYKDAAQLFEQGATADVKAGRLDSAAADFAGLAQVRLRLNQKPTALQALSQALASSKKPSILFQAGRVYVAAAEPAKAHQIAAQLASDSQPESQVFGKIIEGETALQRRDSRHAIQIFTDANNQLDTWIGHFDLGRADSAAGLLVQADSEFDRCLSRSGETLDMFDYVPTYGFLPDVYYEQGNVRQGMNGKKNVDSYLKYLSIRGAAGEDPLLSDVRHRLVK